MSTAAAASGEQLLAWVRAALAQAEARTGLPGFVAVKGRQNLMAQAPWPLSCTAAVHGAETR